MLNCHLFHHLLLISLSKVVVVLVVIVDDFGFKQFWRIFGKINKNVAQQFQPVQKGSWAELKNKTNSGRNTCQTVPLPVSIRGVIVMSAKSTNV